MFRGTNEAYRILMNNIDRPIMVYFDPDVDGLISGYFICKFLENMGLSYKFYINSNRQHGFFIKAEKLEGYLVISVDFNIDLDIIEDFKIYDVVSINIDHHEIKSDFIVWNKGVVINNQYEFEREEKRYLSGAGVVYEVLSVWNENFISQENKALVGITLLSDVRPIENSEAKKYLAETYSMSTEQGYFKYLIDNTVKDSYGFGVPRMDRNFIDYTFSPRINSMFRFNESFEAVNFILGNGLHTEDKRELQREYAEFIIKKSIIEEKNHVNIVIVDMKDLHDTNEMPEKLYEIYETKGYKTAHPSNFIGLACSRVKENGKNTIILLMENDRLLRGSFRGKYDSVDYLKIFRDCGSSVEGHKPAFGILNISIVEELFEVINRAIGVAEIGYKNTETILEVENLSAFCLNRADKVANRNNFVRDQFRTYIKYKGDNIKKIKDGEKYVEYLIDGNRVKSFDTELSIRDGYILPITEKSYITFYLRKLEF